MFGNGLRRGIKAPETQDRPHCTPAHRPNRWQHCVEPKCRRHRICWLGRYCVNPREPLPPTPGRSDLAAALLLRQADALMRRAGIKL